MVGDVQLGFFQVWFHVWVVTRALSLSVLLARAHAVQPFFLFVAVVAEKGKSRETKGKRENNLATK